MKILGCKEGHDGAFAFVDKNRLCTYVESEKDSFPRCGTITNDLLFRVASTFPELPDVLAVGGWTKGLFSSDLPSFSGYFGIGREFEQLKEINFFGKKTIIFSSTHEASHIWNAYSMSPYPQGEPCYILIWEGNVGNFYFVDEQLNITNLGSPLSDPGNRYTFIFSLADKNSPDEVGYYDTSHPGKMMALAAFGSDEKMTPQEDALWRAIKDVPQFQLMNRLKKSDFKNHYLFNIGVETQEFKDFARKVTNEIFDIFERYASEVCKNKNLPLLIAGGCGLNCEWNSRWLHCGLFRDVFIPPCCNDSGSAAGTAAHAMYRLTGKAKLDWSAYGGETFVLDEDLEAGPYSLVEMTSATLSKKIQDGSVVAWIEGKYEIGPRALGHRSLIASANLPDSLHKLNLIKKRETYRPVAPIAMLEALDLFDPPRVSPYMLFFHSVKTDKLPAITHVDKSARLQTVDEFQAPHLHKILKETQRTHGAGVLCNTSLNFPGKGFINRASDLLRFSIQNNLDGFSIDGKTYWKQT